MNKRKKKGKLKKERKKDKYKSMYIQSAPKPLWIVEQKRSCKITKCRQ